MPDVLTEKPRPSTTVVTLNRPERLNALTVDMASRLHEALDAVAADSACRVVILTGAGRGFCAGLDIRAGDPEAARARGLWPALAASAPDIGDVQAAMAVQGRIADVVTHMRALPQPVVAAVNGAATGGGLALALAADIRVAAASARFNAAFVRVGLSACDMGVSYLLPRLVGASRAAELMLTGRLIEAAEAERIGLVHEVVADGEVLAAAVRVADGIIANSPFGVAMTKEVMWANLDAPSLQWAIELENRTQLLALQTADHAEARNAFLERREPGFTNH